MISITDIPSLWVIHFYLFTFQIVALLGVALVSSPVAYAFAAVILTWNKPGKSREKALKQLCKLKPIFRKKAN